MEAINKPIPELASKEKAAKILHISESTLDRYVKGGLIKVYKMGIGRKSKCWYKVAELIEFLERL